MSDNEYEGLSEYEVMRRRLVARAEAAERERDEYKRKLDALVTAVDTACQLIELGDQRLLASDGPAGGQPPDLSLGEWRQLYKTLNRARQFA